MNKFPKGFLWGAATSSHQVEGGTRNDWSEWEKKNASRLAKDAKKYWQSWQQQKFPEMLKPENYISGRACEHYSRYEEDFDLAKAGGHNAHRFSIEWSRIEPEEGKFDEKEIEHYRKIIKALKERDIEPMVTLWHFTDPVWISNIGGWQNEETIKYFVRYAEKIFSSYGNEVKLWLTFNEPTTYAGHVHIFGAWLSRKKSLLLADRVIKNICTAHRETFRLFHQRYENSGQLGVVFNVKCHKPYSEKNMLDKMLAWVDEYFRDMRYIKMIINYSDFLGLNYYFKDYLHFSLGGKFFGLADLKNPDSKVSDLGWDLSAEGIYCVLKKLKKFNLPIYITENGLADARDEKREWYLGEIIKKIQEAIKDGVDVRGYLHWSFMDNFEWDKGFWPRFGLIEIDYKTLERRPRKSFYAYKKIIENNGV